MRKKEELVSVLKRHNNGAERARLEWREILHMHNDFHELFT